MDIKSTNPVLQDLDNLTFDRPAGGPMTVEGVVQKTALLFAPLLATAAAVYLWAPPLPILPIILVAALFGIAATMSKTVRPALMFVYAVLEGAVLGAVTGAFEQQFPGIAVQALAATLITAAVVFALYRLRIVRATSRFRRIVILGTVGYIVFLLASIAFSLFTI